MQMQCRQCWSTGTPDSSTIIRPCQITMDLIQILDLFSILVRLHSYWLDVFNLLKTVLAVIVASVCDEVSQFVGFRSRIHGPINASAPRQISTNYYFLRQYKRAAVPNGTKIFFFSTHHHPLIFHISSTSLVLAQYHAIL